MTNPGALYEVAGLVSTGPLTVGGTGRLGVTGVANLTSYPAISPGATFALENEAGGNVLPGGPLTVPSGTFEIAPGAVPNGTNLVLSGGAITLGHQGLQGFYAQAGGNYPADFSGTLAAAKDAFFANYSNAGNGPKTARTTTSGQTNLDFNNGFGFGAAVLKPGFWRNCQLPGVFRWQDRYPFARNLYVCDDQ